ncbi:MAG: amidohydrolase family protein [Pseudomonadota bacterium]
MAEAPEQRIADVLVPRALVSDPAAFGGAVQGDCLRGDLILKAGQVAGLQAATGKGSARLVLPKLVEPHVHLDKCHTIDRLADVGGDLHAAIAEQWRDKQSWTAEDLRSRATRGLKELEAACCGTVRSHVDWSHGQDAMQVPVSWSVLLECGQDSALDLQLSPLVGVEDFIQPGVAHFIADQTAQAGAALGCFVNNQGRRAEGIRQAFIAAAEAGVPLDFHVDEGLEPGLDGLDLIADTAQELGFEHPILCGHACSLMNLHGDALHRLAEKCARVPITVCALPTTNLYLQGRSDGTPDRRGITRIKELQRAGVPVIIGTDNVRDAFCPIGRHDPLASLALAALTAHLDPPTGDHLPMITTDAARALGRAPVFVDQAQARDLLISDAQSTSDLLAGSSPLTPLSTSIQGDT